MDGKRRWWWAAAALLAVFVSARGFLIARSYDTVANWEEAVFLFSGVDLGEQGVTHLFDYQDDLSHGGSLPLVAIATPWVRIVGWRLDALKGIAVVWSAATLLALFMVGTRFASPRFGLLLGLLYAASPYTAMLQVTLVGSHPEAVLFMVLALAAYLRTLESGRDGAAAAVLLGCACALATWCSYIAAPLSAALGGFYVLRRPRHALAAAAGAVVGLAPWIVQNLVLRPHGAMQWTERTAHQATPAVPWNLFARTAESLAGEPGVGFAVLGVLGSLAGWALFACWRDVRPNDAGVALRPAAVLPVACATLLSFLVLAAAQPAALPAEGFYYFRYFVPVQVLLFWLAALGIETLTVRFGSAVFAVAAGATVSLALATQIPLYRGSNSYVPNASRDFGQGCAVFGHAEVDRAASDEDAVARLEVIADIPCRRTASYGYGWGVVSRYARDGDGEFLARSLEKVREPALHARACSGARHLMDGYSEDAISHDRKLTGSVYIDSACPRSLN